VRFTDGSLRTYRYEDSRFPNALTGVVDESGRRSVTWSYDTAGRPNGNFYGPAHAPVNPISVVYAGNQVSVTDVRGAVRTRQLVDLAGKRHVTAVSTAAPAFASTGWSFVRDGAGAPTRTVTRTGEVIERDNDARGLPHWQTRAKGTAEERTTSFLWHPQWRKPTQIAAQGLVTRQDIDSLGRVWRVRRTGTDGIERVMKTIGYNAQGLVGTVTDADNRTTTYGYDAAGNLASVTDPAAQVTRFLDHNAHGQARRIEFADGTVATRGFDARFRLVSFSHAGRTTTTTYDAAGRHTSTTAPDMSWTSIAHDDAGFVRTISNHWGETITIGRDAAGKETSRTVRNAAGQVIQAGTRGFDTVGRTAWVRDSRQHQTSFGYLPDARLANRTDPTNRVVSQTLDKLDRVRAVTQPNTTAMRNLGGPATVSVTRAFASGTDKLSTLTDTASVATTFGHDVLNRPAAEASADAGSASVVRSPQGRVTTATASSGTTTTVTRDALARAQQLQPAGGPSTAYTFVPGRSDGALQSMTWPGGTTTWTRDTNGRVTTKSLGVPGSITPTHLLRFDRDSLGRPTLVTYPSGMQVRYTYTADRITSIHVNGAVLMDNIYWRPFSEAPMGWRWGNGNWHTRSFDADGRVTGTTLGPTNRAYTWDAAGRLASFRDTGPGIDRTSTFGYDEADQLASYAGPQGSHAWAWDTNGNRRSETIHGTSRSYAYQPGTNRLTSLTGLRTITYRPNGAIATDGTGWSYHYDKRERMIEAKRGTTERLLFTYDGLGRRAFKETLKYFTGIPQAVQPMPDGTPAKRGRIVREASGYWEQTAATSFFHDDAGQLLREDEMAPAGGGRVTFHVREHVWLAGMPVATRQDGALFHVHPDHLGTPRSVTRAADGLEVWRWESEPFGTTQPAVNASAAPAPAFRFNLRFPGQYRDAETGLHHNRMRDYDPRTGRYVQVDPIGLAGGVTLPSFDVVHSHSFTRLVSTGPRASVPRTSWG
jgi:RHS repeat-associated protein